MIMTQRKPDYNPGDHDAPRNVFPAQRPQLNETITGQRCGCACNVGDGGRQRDNSGREDESGPILTMPLPAVGIQHPRFQDDLVCEAGPALIDFLSNGTVPVAEPQPIHIRTRFTVYQLGLQGFCMEGDCSEHVQKFDHSHLVHTFEDRGTPDSMLNERGTSTQVSMNSSGVLSQRSDTSGQILAYVGSWADDLAASSSSAH
ncbi:hypothetical protein EV356DRAFT_333592 [Viridothelium virens]|uniref:Uncharacterized protein n=1 Tax=Viridothelium virens TaxID=1048519 RepID=A0A6A6HJL5_VIRVR|nr:hypothetical protein EV356DRAFT_333592 [Viridothelium virens]